MISSKYKILLVDANKEELQILTTTFLQENFDVTSTSKPDEVMRLAKKEHPHLILLELIFPKSDGIDICTDIKREVKLADSLIVFYSTREDDYSQIAAFNAGADDYIVKPKQKRVLLSRINALLRRYKMGDNQESKVGKANAELFIDKERFLVVKDDKKITLPRKEFQLLAYMADSPGRVFTRKEISQFIWGDEIHTQKRTIDVHIRRIRKKVGEKFIETIKGVGYKVNF